MLQSKKYLLAACTGREVANKDDISALGSLANHKEPRL